MTGRKKNRLLQQLPLVAVMRQVGNELNSDVGCPEQKMEEDALHICLIMGSWKLGGIGLPDQI